MLGNYSPTSLIWHVWETRKRSYDRCVTYSIIWQIGPGCHNNEVLHTNTLEIFCHKEILWVFFQMYYKYVNSPHRTYVDLKEESIVLWCCHFKLATNILLSFSNMPCNFIRFAGVKSNELSIKNLANSKIKIFFQQCVEHGNWIKIDLRHCRIRLMSWNECLELRHISITHIFVNTCWNWATLPWKEA